MEKSGIGGFAVKNMGVRMFVSACGFKNVIEKLAAQLSQQKILGFKVGIEGGASNVCQLYDFADRNVGEVLFRQKLREGGKNGLPCFSLTSVRDAHLRTICQKCSVSNIPKKQYVAFLLPRGYNNIEQCIR